MFVRDPPEELLAEISCSLLMECNEKLSSMDIDGVRLCAGRVPEMNLQSCA